MPSSAASKVPLYNSWQSSIALFTCLLLLLLMTLPFSVIVAMPPSSNGKSLNRESTVKSPISSLSFCI